MDSPSVSFDSNELVSISEDNASRRERAHALDSFGDETFVSELVESCIAVLRSDHTTENELKMLAFDALRTLMFSHHGVKAALCVLPMLYVVFEHRSLTDSTHSCHLNKIIILTSYHITYIYS